MFFRPPAPHILPVPHILQRRTGECLAACAAMACEYLHIAYEYERLVRVLEIQWEIGTPFSRIQKLSQLRIGVTFRQGGEMAALYRLLLAGWPVLVAVQTSELAHWQDESSQHVVTLTGMTENNLIVQDPAFVEHPLPVSYGDFDLAWLEMDEAFAVIAPT